jgi:arylsulfatase A
MRGMDFLCDFIRRQRSSGPFFAYYSSKLTHVPQAPTPDGDKDAISVFEAAFNKIEDRKKLSGVQEVAAAEARHRGLHIDTQNFRNNGIAYLDKMAGRLIDELERSDLRDRTLVLFTSDNGNSQLDPLPDGVEPLPGRKGDSREGGTRVPLIANWPGRIAPGSTCEDLVHVQDFLPTFVELAGGTLPESRPCDGHSFAPQLFGEGGSPREWFIGWGAHHNIWLDRVAQELGKPDLEPFRLVWVHGLRYKLYNDGRFYDLKEDLEEAKCIPVDAGSAEAEATRKRFQAILDQFLLDHD